MSETREMLQALLDSSACDSDIGITCRDNWPTDVGSWCGGCQILAVGEAWAQAEEQVAGLKPGGMYAWKCRAERLRAALCGIIGATTRKELEAMEVFIRSQTAPAADKAAAIDAIHALLATE